jgi:prevent-host-death family protein
MVQVSTHEAKTQLSRLLARVQEGEEVQICHGNKPVAKLVPIGSKSSSGRSRPRVGQKTSEPIKWSEEAFAPLTADELADWQR